MLGSRYQHIPEQNAALTVTELGLEEGLVHSCRIGAGKRNGYDARGFLEYPS